MNQTALIMVEEQHIYCKVYLSISSLHDLNYGRCQYFNILHKLLTKFLNSASKLNIIFFPKTNIFYFYDRNIKLRYMLTHGSSYIQIFSRQKRLFYAILSANSQIFDTLISVRIITLIFSSHQIIFRVILIEPVDHIIDIIGPHWFLTTHTSTYTLLIFVMLVFLLKLVFKAHVAVVKIGVKSKIFSSIKN